MKLYLFLRSIVWTSVLSALTIGASLVSAFIGSDLAIPLGLASVALAILSPKADI